MKLYPISIKSEWKYFVLTFVSLFVLYLITMPRGVALEDDGAFILASYYFGIAHPPGYLLHTLFGKLFNLFPIGSVAFRLHALSAFFAGSTCMVIWLLVLSMTGARALAFAAAFGFGCSSIFWSQAIIAEVYTLNTFLFFTVVFISIRFVYQDQESQCKSHSSEIEFEGRNDRLLVALIALIFGLSLSNHWPLILLAAPGLLLIIWPQRKRFLAHVPIALIGLFAGLSPYLWLYVHSRQDLFISFSGPLTTLGDLFFFISRQDYSAVDVDLSAGWRDKLGFIGFAAQQAMRQYTYLGAVLALIGIAVQWKRWPVTLSIGLIYIFLSGTLILILVLHTNFDRFHQDLFRVYPLLSYGVMAVWIAYGLQYIIYKSSGKIGHVIQLNYLQTIIVIGFLGIVIQSNYGENDRRYY